MMMMMMMMMALTSAKSCEIRSEFEVIAGQGHQRLMIFVSIESAYETSY